MFCRRFVLLWLLAAGACLPQTTELRTTFQVRYVASGALYLDGGRSSGLAEGFHLTVKRRQPGAAEMEATTVGEVVVVALAENSAVCEFKSHEKEFAVSDVAYLSAQDAETAHALVSSKNARRYVQVVSFTEGDPLDEELREYVPRPPLPEINRFRGYMAIEQNSILDRGSARTQSVQEGMAVRAEMTRIGGSYWNFTGFWRGRFTSRGGTSVQTLNDLMNRTYHIGLYYDNPNSNYVAGMGRLLLPWASSLSTIDGAYFGRKLGRVTSGIFAGSTPDPASWNYNRDRQIAGVFSSIQAGSFDGVRYTGTAGLAMTRLKWRAERQFAFFENTLLFDRYVSVYHDVEADQMVRGRLGTTESGPVLSRSFLTVRFQPHRIITFDLNHNYFRGIPTFDTRLLGTGLLDKFLFQGLNGGVRLELPARIGVYANVGQSKSQVDNRPSWNRMYGITFGRFWHTGLRADFRHAHFDSNFGNGVYNAISLEREVTDRLRFEV